MDRTGWPVAGGIQANPDPTHLVAGEAAPERARNVVGPARPEKPLIAEASQPVPHTDTGGLGEFPSGGRAILR